jgi:diguanylate cyclase (GGDEF)-like protein
MTVQLFTRADALRHTGKRVAVAVSLTVAMTASLSLWQFGVDPDASVHSGLVTASVIAMGVIVSAILTAGLSYRSALMMQDLTLARAELFRLSRTDPLTGLLNRRGFDEAALAALARANQTNRPAVALMCDIDRFKEINDRFGHQFGDAVLVRIGALMQSLAPDVDTLIGRHGGEEFAILMIGMTDAEALGFARSLLRACAATEILSQDLAVHVTVSIGLSPGHHQAELPRIMRLADQALYLAKNQGRNRIACDAAVDHLAA